MQETPITHPGVPQEVYHMMGKKTFWIFFLQRTQAAFVLLLVTIVFFVLSQQTALMTTKFGDLTRYAVALAELCGLLFIVALAIALFVAWLIYSRYKFCLGDDSLKIKRGILNKEEVSIPYRQIQDVDIKRDLSFQMLGLSRIMILTAGHEDRAADDGDSEGILPALDKNLAEWLQAELLKRANVQKTVMVPETSPQG
jgi:uncharacterized membrane protein YdbT with pleckstrin-like domain